MAEISFALRPGHRRAWVSAAWTVERFLTDVCIAAPDEPRIRDILTEAVAVNNLHLDDLDEPAASCLKKVIEEVVDATLEESESLGLAWKQELDEKSRNHYKRAVAELYVLLTKSDSPTGVDG